MFKVTHHLLGSGLRTHGHRLLDPRAGLRPGQPGAGKQLSQLCRPAQPGDCCQVQVQGRFCHIGAFGAPQQTQDTWTWEAMTPGGPGESLASRHTSVAEPRFFSQSGQQARQATQGNGLLDGTELAALCAAPSQPGPSTTESDVHYIGHGALQHIATIQALPSGVPGSCSSLVASCSQRPHSLQAHGASGSTGCIRVPSAVDMFVLLSPPAPQPRRPRLGNIVPNCTGNGAQALFYLVLQSEARTPTPGPQAQALWQPFCSGPSGSRRGGSAQPCYSLTGRPIQEAAGCHSHLDLGSRAGKPDCSPAVLSAHVPAGPLLKTSGKLSGQSFKAGATGPPGASPLASGRLQGLPSN